MDSPLKYTKKAYTKLVQTGIYRLLRHSPADLLKRGIKRNQLFKFYLQSLQRLNDILYYDYIQKKQLSEEERAKLVNTYFELWKRSSDVVFNQEAERLKTSPDFYHKVNDYYFDFVKGTLHPLFEARTGTSAQEVKYPLTLDAEFAELLTGKFPKPKSPAQVTVVYPFRDRDLRRLKVSVNSLYKNSSIPVDVIVVDYGSSPKYQTQLQELAQELELRVIRSETYGRPWSRGRVLNIGIKAAKTEYIATTDMDMIFAGDALQASLDAYQSDKVIHCRPLWLPEDGGHTKSYLGNHDQLGGFMFIRKAILEELHGFSEEIEFWGLEDSELNKRMKTKNITSLWIDDKVSMYHVWHPLQYGVLDVRPVSSWEESSHVFMASGYLPAEQNNWGEPMSAQQRPILTQMQQADTLEIQVTDYLNQINHIVEQAKQHKLIKLNLGPRLPGTSAEFVKFMQKLSPDFNTYNTELAVKKNKNVDYFYLSLDILKSQGMIDYFLPEEVDYAYLLFS